MKWEITPRGALRFSLTEAERAEMKEEVEFYGMHSAEQELLSQFSANSEFWILDPSSTGDLTEAPMVGLVGPEVDQEELDPQSPRFGQVDTSCGGDRKLCCPIIARWAWMDYQVEFFLERLLATGACVWTGGFASPEYAVFEEGNV